MVHTALVLGLTPLSFGLPISTAQRNLFLLLIFTCGVGGRGMYGEYPEMEMLGVENAASSLPPFTACSHCHK